MNCINLDRKQKPENLKMSQAMEDNPLDRVCYVKMHKEVVWAQSALLGCCCCTVSDRKRNEPISKSDKP